MRGISFIAEHTFFVVPSRASANGAATPGTPPDCQNTHAHTYTHTFRCTGRLARSNERVREGIGREIERSRDRERREDSRGCVWCEKERERQSYRFWGTGGGRKGFCCACTASANRRSLSLLSDRFLHIASLRMGATAALTGLWSIVGSVAQIGR